ncbi:PD-(D/E)XK nuclease family protein [Agrobacterium tumefaciens]|nr:PD-(D/E)XK nuclease family protein [Agrobacterium tumefaciens]NTE22225.1 PD-(D/E)XK nuclease family protein [Agrobacterium tumefaciens]
MNLEEFLSEGAFDNIDERLKNIQAEIERNSYNLFTLSSYNSYLENFHSDVITMLLDSDERHGQRNVFLKLFLDFLIDKGANLNMDDYVLCEITRERGRIDVWIKDATSKKCIILENKINNAGDQENQLETYFNYAKRRGYVVDAVVYLTLNGIKHAPLTHLSELNSKMINIAAFTNTNKDLSNGWLQKCYQAVSDEDNRSFIFQFIKLLKHLSQVGLDRQIKDDFYAIINKSEGFEKSKAIAELLAGLESYRTELFSSKVGNDYLPFRKIYRWRPNHWLFENYEDNGIIFKLDVHFHTDGSARIDFWNPGQSEEQQQVNVSTKLNSIGFLHEFKTGGFGGGMYKAFDLDNWTNIQAIDEALFLFVKRFFEMLKG